MLGHVMPPCCQPPLKPSLRWKRKVALGLELQLLPARERERERERDIATSRNVLSDENILTDFPRTPSDELLTIEKIFECHNISGIYSQSSARLNFHIHTQVGVDTRHWTFWENWKQLNPIRTFCPG